MLPYLHPIVLVQFSDSDQGCEKTADKECEKTDEDEEMKKAFEKWKSKTFSLTVPLRVVSLRGSVPPSWIKVCRTSCLALM